MIYLFANYIKKRLGFGKIYGIKGKEAVVLHPFGGQKAGIEKVVNLVNEKLRVPFKVQCIQKYYLDTNRIKLINNLALNI